MVYGKDGDCFVDFKIKEKCGDFYRKVDSGEKVSAKDAVRRIKKFMKDVDEDLDRELNDGGIF